MVNDDKLWQTLVDTGRRLVTEIGDRKWELGDLANEVCPATDNGVRNDDTLGKFADEIGISRSTLKVYRYVASRWSAVARVTAQTWTTHRMLAEREDRHEIIAEQTWTYNSLSERLGRLPNPSRRPISEAQQAGFDAEPDEAPAIEDWTPEQKREAFVSLSEDEAVTDDKQTRRSAEKNLDAAFKRSDFGMKSAHAKEQEEATQKSASELRFVGATAGLATAKRKLREVIAEIKGVNLSDEHIELLGSDLDDIDSLVNLLRARLAGDANVDWDAELASLTGGEF